MHNDILGIMVISLNGKANEDPICFLFCEVKTLFVHIIVR
jgi:hypothetical protein